MLDKRLINSCLQDKEAEELMLNNVWFYQVVSLLRHPDCTEEVFLNHIKILCKSLEEMRKELMQYQIHFGDLNAPKPKEYFGPGDVTLIPPKSELIEEIKKLVDEGKVVFDPVEQPYAAEVVKMERQQQEKSILYCEGGECKHVLDFSLEGLCCDCDESNGYKNYEPRDEEALNFKKCYECKFYGTPVIEIECADCRPENNYKNYICRWSQLAEEPVKQSENKKDCLECINSDIQGTPLLHTQLCANCGPEKKNFSEWPF